MEDHVSQPTAGVEIGSKEAIQAWLGLEPTEYRPITPTVTQERPDKLRTDADVFGNDEAQSRYLDDLATVVAIAQRLHRIRGIAGRVGGFMSLTRRRITGI